MATSLEKELNRYVGLLPKGALKELVAFAKKLSAQYSAEINKTDLSYDLRNLSEFETNHLEEEFVEYRKLYTRE
jgi:hypothetical protein